MKMPTPSHVFLSQYYAHHKCFINEVDAPSGVLATSKEANAEAISLVGDYHCNCADPDPDDTVADYDHICSDVSTDEDGCVTISYESGDGSFRIEASVIAMEYAALEVWVLKVAGVVRENAVFESQIGVVKAVRRELKALQKTGMAAYEIVNDGLEI